MALNFNDVTAPGLCSTYFQGLATIADLEEAADLTSTFRNHPGYSSYAWGFIIDRVTIDDMLLQNGGNISGIKVYMGIDKNTPTVFKAVAVATFNGQAYDDFGIPGLKTEPCNAILAEGRPCPIHCGARNALNS